MRQSIRLLWRTARFEILAAVTGSLLLMTAIAVLAERMRALYVERCGGHGFCSDADLYNLNQAFAEPLMPVMLVAPVALGTLLGAPLVSRELERRSAPLAWSLVRSRVRWLLWRAIPAAALVGLLLVGPALAASELVAVRWTGYDPGKSFLDYGLKGELVVVRGLFAFAVGIAAGAWFGRVLPAVITTLAIGFLAVGAMNLAMWGWLPREVIPSVIIEQDSAESPLYLGEGVQLPDGRLLTIDESASLRPADAQRFDSPGFARWVFGSGVTRVDLGIRGTHLREIELREGTTLGVAALAALGIGAFIVRRRRPLPGRALDIDSRPAATARSPEASTRRPIGGARLTWLLTLRVGRAESLAALAVGGIAIGGAVMLELSLAAARAEQGCDPTCSGGGPFIDLLNAWKDDIRPWYGALPFVIGGVLGVPLVAREVEARTIHLAWALTRSRLRWLLWRLWPAAVLVLVLLVPAWLAVDRVVGQLYLVEPSKQLDDYGEHGLVLVSRGIFALAVGVLFGAYFRRILPALITVAVVSAVSYAALDVQRLRWLPMDVLPDSLIVGDEQQGAWGVTQGWLGPDGFHTDIEELVARAGLPPVPESRSTEAFQQWLDANGYERVWLGLLGERLVDVEVRETALLSVLSLSALAGAAVLIRERAAR